MLSLKLFDTLEYICRHTRKHKKYFGSLQVIVIGDFFQLPPVPDLLKGDKGQYCFLSEKFQNIFQKHFVVLTDVLRQTEVDFITCINEVSKGTLLSEESLALLQRMKIPLPPGPPLFVSVPKNLTVMFLMHQNFLIFLVKLNVMLQRTVVKRNI